MIFKIARAARRHKFNNYRIRAAVAGRLPSRTWVEETDGGGKVTLVEWFTADERGIDLHIVGKIAIENPALVVIFHCKPIKLEWGGKANG